MIGTGVLVRQWCRGAFAAAVLVSCAACDGGATAGRPKVFPATGMVRYKGKPAGNVIVSLVAADGKEYVEAGGTKYRPRAQTNLQGEFALSTFDAKDGAPAGEYLVALESVGPPDAPYNSDTPTDYLKGRYRDPAKTNIKVAIKPGDNVLSEIDLK